MNPIVRVYADGSDVVAGGVAGLLLGYELPTHERAALLDKHRLPAGYADSLLYGPDHAAWKASNPVIEEETKVKEAIRETQSELEALEHRLQRADANPLSIGKGYRDDLAMREPLQRKLRQLKAKFGEAKRLAGDAEAAWVKARKAVLTADTQKKLAALALELEPLLNRLPEVIRLQNLLSQLR